MKVRVTRALTWTVESPVESYTDYTNGDEDARQMSRDEIMAWEYEMEIGDILEGLEMHEGPIDRSCKVEFIQEVTDGE